MADSLRAPIEKADAAAKGQLREDPWQLMMRIVLGIAGGPARAA